MDPNNNEQNLNGVTSQPEAQQPSSTTPPTETPSVSPPTTTTETPQQQGGFFRNLFGRNNNATEQQSPTTNSDVTSTDAWNATHTERQEAKPDSTLGIPTAPAPTETPQTTPESPDATQQSQEASIHEMFRQTPDVASVSNTQQPVTPAVENTTPIANVEQNTDQTEITAPHDTLVEAQRDEGLTTPQTPSSAEATTEPPMNQPVQSLESVEEERSKMSPLEAPTQTPQTTLDSDQPAGANSTETPTIPESTTDVPPMTPVNPTEENTTPQNVTPIADRLPSDAPNAAPLGTTETPAGTDSINTPSDNNSQDDLQAA